MAVYAYIIIDVVILVILILFAVRGGRRGLVLGLAGLFSILIAFAGAGYIASHYSQAVADRMSPYISEAVEEKLKDSGVSGDTQTSGGGETGNDTQSETQTDKVTEALKKLGLYDGIAKTVSAGISESVSSIGTAISTAVTESLAGTLAYILLFVLSFIVILLLLKLIAHLLNLFFKLPGLNFLNMLGGGILGLIQGILILFLAAWVLRLFGNIIPEDVAQKTVLLKFFLETNLLTLLSGV
ncbi:CvpA family protein [Papillibacter cinnamivorans]|uniref:Colicin V production protein n=1 Tax=Papillibacter cinnamivorans DSM 12816 TaxID=1122930 RepID=A0A1W2B7Y1_9FIRM|nr:CvpA family protein [Papillibacter cinnamivorans]SMC68802.1 Colicin V production protein [Papillibacter cinnamivorans DSM 12816]